MLKRRIVRATYRGIANKPPCSPSSIMQRTNEPSSDGRVPRAIIFEPGTLPKPGANCRKHPVSLGVASHCAGSSKQGKRRSQAVGLTMDPILWF